MPCCQSGIVRFYGIHNVIYFRFEFTLFIQDGNTLTLEKITGHITALKGIGRVARGHEHNFGPAL